MAVRKGVSLHALGIFICLGLTLFVCSCFSQTNREDGNTLCGTSQATRLSLPELRI